MKLLSLTCLSTPTIFSRDLRRVQITILNLGIPPMETAFSGSFTANLKY